MFDCLVVSSTLYLLLTQLLQNVQSALSINKPSLIINEFFSSQTKPWQKSNKNKNLNNKAKNNTSGIGSTDLCWAHQSVGRWLKCKNVNFFLSGANISFKQISLFYQQTK